MQPTNSPHDLDPNAPFRKLRSLAECGERGAAAYLELRNDLVVRHRGLAVRLARCFSQSPQEREEFESIALLALIDAVEQFDPDRGFRFSTFATTCMRNRIFRTLKQRDRRSGREVLAGAAIMSAVASDASVSSDALDAAEEQTRLRRALTRLSPRRRRLVMLRFGLDGPDRGCSFREIGDQVRLSKERVRQLVHESLTELRAALQESPSPASLS